MQHQPPLTHFPAYPNPPENERVRGLLCADATGQVQVVAPEKSVVDHEIMSNTLSRDLHYIPHAELEPICAVPGFYDIPALVHGELKSRQQVALATNVPGQYIKVTGQQVADLCSTAHVTETHFCEDLRFTPISSKADYDDIVHSVEQFTTRRIEARLDETLHIPPLPEAAQRIIALQRNPNCDLDDLVKIIETDPAIAARIMGWANSARYGLAVPAVTIEEAIMRCLGFDLVFNMALGMALGATLNLPKSEVSGASPYWLTAVYAAALAESLAHQIPVNDRPNPGTCYLTGLLSNFGTLIVGHVFPPQYETICRIAEANPQLHHTVIDQHVLTLNREVMASSLLELWDLPDELSTAVRYQYVEDYVGEHQSYVHLLKLAHSIMRVESETPTTEQLVQAEQLQISEEKLTDVMETISASRQDLGDLAQSLVR